MSTIELTDTETVIFRNGGHVEIGFGWVLERYGGDGLS